MFDDNAHTSGDSDGQNPPTGPVRVAQAAAAGVVRAVDAGDLVTTTARMAATRDGMSDAQRVDLLGAAEALKNAASGLQAVLAADLDRSQRQRQAERGVPAARLGQGIGAQVGLARQESPNRGGQLLGLATVLATEMPHTLAALRSGALSEWRATLIARETACLGAAHRREVDATIAADPAALQGTGNGRLADRARKLAYRLDPHAALARSRRAESDRRVSIRPAPDTMAWISALLPVRDGVGVYAALTRAADSARAHGGDTRPRGQVMADTLITRVTGRPTAQGIDTTSGRGHDTTTCRGEDRATDHRAAAPPEHRQPLMLNLVLTDRTLLRGDAEPAHLQGYGAIPAGWARQQVADQLARDGADGASTVFVRTVYTAPGSGALVAMASRARHVPPGLSRLLRLRDQTCRTPWCDAPVRHVDHVVEHQRGGPTSEANLQGLCEACNHAKQAPGWRARPESSTPRAGPGRSHTVVLTTPTGHRHRTTAPPLPRARPEQAPLVPRARPEEDLPVDTAVSGSAAIS